MSITRVQVELLQKGTGRVGLGLGWESKLMDVVDSAVLCWMLRATVQQTQEPLVQAEASAAAPPAEEQAHSGLHGRVLRTKLELASAS